ncbi:MAG: AraC family transcriptional regulator [Paenibacillus sp.]|uniref:helix-turn-helix domain-containing protein n=1 Tax=Paenibacillus sp. TaxID=58172 RepID=UPI00290DA896|nr:AraC family transcriptional regulator [Paenibacillus sp.]MDU4695888.1 AraC family transcriptional regulator [Paenibacillus sp.]
MPQIDRYKNRIVHIEFVPMEDVSRLPYPERRSLVLITSGRLQGTLNGHPISIEAPAVLCLAGDDDMKVTEMQGIAAQAFHFHPEFLKSVRLSETEEVFPSVPSIQTGQSFFQRVGPYPILPRMTSQAYPHIFEWFFVLGTEVMAQSDERWACRIKKYLIQILGLLEELNQNREPSPVDQVLEYIHANYPRKIILEDLTRTAHLNRVSLNKLFQARCGTTAMGYLLSYRFKVACELLTHTDMNLNDIARATGFEYDTYFIKQFTSKKGMSPTTYRNQSRKFSNAQ